MEEQVYNYLITNHIGKDNLIKNIDLRKKFNIRSDKSMRKVIQNIREDKKYYMNKPLTLLKGSTPACCLSVTIII